MSMWVTDDDDDETGWVDHEPPFADPAIRKEFEAALGAFILSFNEADYFVGQLLRGELTRNNRMHLYDPAHNFASRLALLEGIAPMADNLKVLPFTALRKIAALRNTLAHGHFDQNPFGGDYKLIIREKYRALSAEGVKSAAIELGTIIEALRIARVLYDFM